MSRAFDFYDAESAYMEPIQAPCLSPQCPDNQGRTTGKMQTYRSDACPVCGVLG